MMTVQHSSTVQMPIAKLMPRLGLLAALACVVLVGLAVGAGRAFRPEGIIAYGVGNIYLVDIDTGLTLRFTSLGDVGEVNWSPNGISVALLRWDRERNNYDIYMISMDERHLTRLTDNDAADFDLSWSPDSNSLAFVSTRNGDADIYTIDVRSQRTNQLVDNKEYDTEPAWSPDGRQIAFISGGTFSGGNIYVVDIEGNNLQQLTEGHDYSPSWSPDAKYLAFARASSDGLSIDIFTLSLDNGELRQITQDGFSKRCLAWSADGSRIAFLADNGSNNEIFIMDVNDTQVHQLHREDLSSVPGCPAWLP
jgi:TolB protein